MSDAYFDADKAADEDKAMYLFMQAMIHFLHTPNRKNAVIAIEKALAYSTLAKEHPRHMKKLVKQLTSNNIEGWRNFQSMAKRNLFFQFNPELEKTFIETAQKRKIGSLQWII